MLYALILKINNSARIQFSQYIADINCYLYSGISFPDHSLQAHEINFASSYSARHAFNNKF